MQPEVVAKLAHIRQRVDADRDRDPRRRVEYSPQDFERDIVALLEVRYSFGVLPSVKIFGTRERNSSDNGHEIDAIIHVKKDAVDTLILVEAKKQSLRLERDEWWASYADGLKPVRAQLNSHAKIIREYLGPLARHVDMQLVSIVVSSDPLTRHVRAQGALNIPQHLCSFIELPSIVEDIIKAGTVGQDVKVRALRVEQSLFLNTLRIGLPEPHLGHPELANAVRYVERCRRALDEALFQKFSPTPERWLIVGTAGMGKSVLLAYAAAVLSSGHRLDIALGDTFTRKDSELFGKIGYDADPTRGPVALMAMSEKQLQSLRVWYGFFQDRLREGDHSGSVTFRPPVFALCRDEESFKSASQWSALLIDEAHDLPVWAPALISKLNGDGTYIAAAFDPHQRIRQRELSTRYIPGLNFSSKALRLSQVYRNPAPIYIASLAIMFRWFAERGPKIIPTPTEMKDMFGLTANSVPGQQGMLVSIKSDAHPANSWCHTVGQLPDATTAFAILTNERMGRREVLWVRFSEEDPDFDYEALAKHFTYHNCRIPNADELSNKYIKGQDYPIVVIEGFPGFMDDYSGSGERKAEDAEKRMWQFRRELYLCASRATCFLYFICKVPESEPILRVRAELDALIAATSVPEDRRSNGTRTWHFQITKPETTRTLATIEQLEGNSVGAEARTEVAPAPAKEPVKRPEVPAAVSPAASKTVAPPMPPRPTTMTPTASPTKVPPVRPVTPNSIQNPSTPAAIVRPVLSSLSPKTHSPLANPVAPALTPQRPSISIANIPTGLPRLQLQGEITPRRLATALGKRTPLEIIRDLQILGEYPNRDTVIASDVAAQVCQKHGYKLVTGAERR